MSRGHLCGPINILIETKKPIDINENYVETSKKYGGTGVTKGQPPKSAVFVPMIVGDVVKGSISLQNVDRENAFTDSDLRLLDNNNQQHECGFGKCKTL